jgi:hypothetical protein
MNSNLSVLQSVVDKVRLLLDEPDVDAKYSDTVLFSEFVVPSMSDVLSRFMLTADNPVYFRMTLNVVDGTKYYTLPPCVQEVTGLLRVDDNSQLILGDAYPLSKRSPRGPGWYLEGNVLVIDPLPAQDLTLYLEYIPSPDLVPHYSSGSNSFTATSSTVHTVALDTTPNLGLLDRRDNAYAGYTLRLLSASGVIEERLVERS